MIFAVSGFVLARALCWDKPGTTQRDDGRPHRPFSFCTACCDTGVSSPAPVTEGKTAGLMEDVEAYLEAQVEVRVQGGASVGPHNAVPTQAM